MDYNMFKEVQRVFEQDDLPVETQDEGMNEESILEIAEMLGVTPDQMEEFKKGITVELEHLDTADGDKILIGKIALDHIKETPAGKSYYDALEQMEHELQETPEEEKAEQVEVPAGEEVIEPISATEGVVPENPSEVDQAGNTLKKLTEEEELKDLPKEQKEVEDGFVQPKAKDAKNTVTDISPAPEVAAPVATDKPKDTDKTDDLPKEQPKVENEK